MLPVPQIPESAFIFVWAGLLIMAVVGLLAGYRRWQSESALVVLSSDEYKADRKALLDEVAKVVADEAHQTRELLSVKMDSLWTSLDRVEKNAASREDLARIRGRVDTLETVNKIYHGIPGPRDSSAMRASA